MAKSNVVELELPSMPESMLIATISGLEAGMLQNRMTDDERDKIKGIKKGGPRSDYSEKAKKWKDTCHFNKAGKLGFPAEAFLKAMGTVVPGVELSKKNLFKYPKNLYRALRIECDDLDQDGNGIVLYSAGKLSMSEHFAVLQGSTPIPVYRGHVKEWEMVLRIVYDSTLLTEHDVMMLLARAGKRIGIGAWRIENRGAYGQFEVKSAKLIKEATPVAA